MGAWWLPQILRSNRVEGIKAAPQGIHRIAVPVQTDMMYQSGIFMDYQNGVMMKFGSINN